MGWSDKLKAKLDTTKEFASQAKDKATSFSSNAYNKTKEKISEIDISKTFDKTKEFASQAGEKVSSVSSNAYNKTKEKANELSEKISEVDWSKIKDSDFRKSQFHKYKDLTSEKISNYFKSTFEFDKDSEEIVNNVKNSFPVPAKTTDDIFEQCKQEAIRRATSAFFLTGMLEKIDNQSKAKYENLSETYAEFTDKVGGHGIISDPNYNEMKDIRANAKSDFTQLDNGYNKSDPLYGFDADIEHVVSKKEYYDDILLRAGTTDEELIKTINSKENLVFADSSLNRSLQDKNIHEYLAERGVPHVDNPDLIDVEINGNIVTVNKKDVEEAFTTAEKNRKSHKITAIKEIGTTAVKTGATLAVQQVVGLIVVETIDVFVDEIKIFANNFSLFSKDGSITNTKETSKRIKEKLEIRFEERQIWQQAKKLGIESGVSGALSVIPQIMIATILKMPAFILGLVREGTLSIVRSIRILASKNPDKLKAIMVIMAGTASGVVGLYVSRIISSGIAGVPLLNRFNSQVTNVFSGLLITAIPLTAIYVFDKNKSKFVFRFGSKDNAENS